MTIEVQDAREVRIDPPVEVTIMRWPVLERKTDEDGKLVKSDASYVRTKQPLERRVVSAYAFTRRSRVQILFALVDYREFSIRNGRGIGLPDWVLDPKDLKTLRSLAGLMWPTTPKPAEKAEPEEDDEDDSLQRAIGGAANDTG
jgi:hypothetical protein